MVWSTQQFCCPNQAFRSIAGRAVGWTIETYSILLIKVYGAFALSALGFSSVHSLPCWVGMHLSHLDWR